ncbi:MAG: aldo/keto reductase [Planctomycetota bacterium]
MKNRQIPKTDLCVSPICMGTMSFGTPVAEADAIKVTHYAIEHGINFIDTANMYEGYARKIGSAGGVAEEILGKALAGKRDKVVIQTKVGMKVGDKPEDEGTSPAAIRKHMDLSLKRLEMDWVDIYYLHKPDPEVPMADVLGSLSEAIDSGKIRYYGVSNYPADKLELLLKVADENNLPRPVICQPPLSLLKQDTLTDLLPLCERESIAVSPYQALQSGLLTGIYKRSAPLPANSRKAQQSNWVWDLTDELFDKLEAIQKQADEKGISMLAFAIRWVLNCPAVVSALIGTENYTQVDQAIAAADE